MTELDRQSLIVAIANREGTASELAKWYEVSVAELKEFTEAHLAEIELASQAIDESDSDEPTPTELAELWISNKFERLLRYQQVADRLFTAVKAGAIGDAVILRELRAYMNAAANELGQLLHRGSGDIGEGDTLSVDIEGVDMNSLR